MEISRKTQRWGIVIELAGNLELATRHALSDVEELEVAGQNVALDLSQVDFMDSSGLGSLVQVIRRFRESDHRLLLVGPNPNVLKLLTFTSIDQIVTIVANLEEAEKALQDG